jgi:putative transposase
MGLLTAEGRSRSTSAREAHIERGYTLKEIARFWGIHYATVSRMIRKSEEPLWRGKT